MADRTQGEGVARRPERDLTTEQPVEIRRHLDALRRARVFIVVFVVLVTATVVADSLLVPSSYRASATIVLEQTLNPFGTTDVSVIERQLQTINRLLHTNQVLKAAAANVPGQTQDSLDNKVSSTVDSSANIITVFAVDHQPARAQAIANAVAHAFLDKQRTTERARLAAARGRLQDELDRLRIGGGNSAEIEAVRQRMSELSVSEVSAGSELQLAQEAEKPTQPYSPRPVRNGVLAFFASIFLAVLLALGRDRLVPRVSGTRELSQLLGLPVLVGVPYIRRRFGRESGVVRATANEAYQTLQATVRFRLPPTSQRVVFVTSAVEGEGKTNAAAGLARSLARVGQKTLAISADLRFPALHEQLGISAAPGLSDILAAANDGQSSPANMLAAFQRTVATNVDGTAGRLHAVGSGTRVHDPAEVLFTHALEEFFGVLAELDYAYVVVDGPPLLGIADSHALAQRADGVIIISRLDRLRVEDVVDMGDLLERLEIRPLGVVAVGVRRTPSYAYAGTVSPEETPVRRLQA